jgi:hypothetical protein
MRGVIIVGLFAMGCGGPVLQNAPKPDPAVVAGAAAAIAGAATLADPNGAAKKQEANKPQSEKRPQNVKATVPSDVFDRLDEQQKNPPPKKSEERREVKSDVDNPTSDRPVPEAPLISDPDPR